MHSKHIKHTLTRAGALLLAAGMGVSLLGLTGCRKDDGAGKVINYPVEEAPRRLDPAVARSSEELLVVGNCMEGLVREDADGRLVPGVAEKWETSADGLALTFHLRKDSHWRLPGGAQALLGDEGLRAMGAQAPAEEKAPVYAPVTAGDFVFGLRRAVSPEVNAPDAAGLLAIADVRAADRFTLEIMLEKPGGDAFLYALARSAAMPCNRVYFEACGGRYGLEPKYLPCNGPFYLEKMGESLTRLKPNEGYSDSGGALPATVNLWTEPDAFLRARLLGTEYDAAIVPADFAASAPEGTESRELKNATLALVFNCGAGALEDVSVRVALCAALEPGALGFDTAAVAGLLPDGMRAGGANYREKAGPAEGIAYNPARANALAENAREKIVLRLLCAPEHETLMRRALQAWQKVFRLGLAAQIETPEPEELEERLEAGDFDVAVVNLKLEHAAAAQALRALEGAGSPARYQSAALETLLAAAAQSGDTVRACRQAEEHLLQNGVYYPLEARSGRLLVASGVEGLEVSPVGDRVFFGGVRKWD